MTVKNFMAAFFCEGLTLDRALVAVSMGRMKGISDPLMRVDDNTPDFPVVTYSHFITYEFLSHQTLTEPVMYPSYNSSQTSSLTL